MAQRQGYVATRPVAVQSFGPGGQKYVADLVSGFKLISGQKQFTFFDFSTSQPDAWSKALTNLPEAGKIGNSMAMIGFQYGIRLIKVNGSAASAAELADLTAMLGTGTLRFFIGSNQTRVLDLDTSHFLNVITTDSADTAGSPALSLPINNAAWVSLPGNLRQPLEANVEISGEFICNLPSGVPASIGTAEPASPKWLFKFVIAGEKQVK